MTNAKTPFLLLPLLMLACSLTAQVTPSPSNERSTVLLSPRKVISTQAPISPPIELRTLPLVCKVKTDVLDGRLNVRACGGLACPVLAAIYEGDNLTIIQTVNGWLEVQTAGNPSTDSGYNLRGWVNSNYCEVKK